MKVLIRADASSVIGIGHVMRCLTLANELRARGAEIVFACSEFSGHLIAYIGAQAFEVIPLAAPSLPLNWQADAHSLQVKITPDFDWIIVDHYGLDKDWECAMRPFTKYIAVIDDLCNRPHDANLLLDQNLSAERDAYEQWVPTHCQLLLGPKYALLRSEFIGGPITIKPQIERILVNFGGADPSREMFKVMEALQETQGIHVDFVAGRSNLAWHELQQHILSQPNWHFYHYVDDFSQLMRQADLFIGAGGSSTWERAALGLPSICIAVAENQVSIAQVMHANGMHCYLGDSASVTAADIRQQVAALSDLSQRLSWANQSFTLVDAKGAGRVATALLQSTLQMRNVVFDDASLLFTARNAPEVRIWSLESDVLSWEAHCAWLKNKLSSFDTLLLIGEAIDGPVGIVRFDRFMDKQVEISIYLLQGRYQMGWGRVLLRAAETYLIKNWPDTKCIRAFIKEENSVSIRMFVAAGYQLEQGYYLHYIQ
ncbi:UDP-2,4-diacetamido-2,4,6-trideoxy-beta-L-altropyranose hydrolase [Janthinobacterium sp. B9-8]|uniref:UDP-2,4-diacetamido-2,4, 6-trideoxy-beta-L-altropyranose hydrolase n=1 Tax=Janthinobacterium sp. B9-8 TaxID=1236179 RepID=UPI00061CDC42|nr:UDP-2,4-diacetamido-2,4,6-trideoxy-beta-L-altropyranose hydrolase [Janthinobacterium sp. B9-8]